jgi:hypothetical protein
VEDLAGGVEVDEGGEDEVEAGKWEEVEVEKAREAIGRITDRSGVEDLASEAMARSEMRCRGEEPKERAIGDEGKSL